MGRAARPEERLPAQRCGRSAAGDQQITEADNACLKEAMRDLEREMAECQRHRRNDRARADAAEKKVQELESKIKKPDQACLRNDQQSEQQAGNLVKEPTLAQSRSSSTTGIMPSMHRKATSVTASPSKTRKAGPGDAERNMPKSIAQESSTAKKITIE